MKLLKSIKLVVHIFIIRRQKKKKRQRVVSFFQKNLSYLLSFAFKLFEGRNTTVLDSAITILLCFFRVGAFSTFTGFGEKNTEVRDIHLFTFKYGFFLPV